MTSRILFIDSNVADSNDFIVYNTVTGALLYDADGNGAVAAVQIATLAGGLALTNADFVVIQDRGAEKILIKIRAYFAVKKLQWIENANA